MMGEYPALSPEDIEAIAAQARKNHPPRTVIDGLDGEACRREALKQFFAAKYRADQAMITGAW